MNRLIIENIEGRIMLGVVMFVSIMILIGWVAINEPARMAAFVEQHNGRSIERGAELFAANCSGCHGAAGYGQTGVAPALNNPQLFGYNFLADLTGPMGSQLRQAADFRAEIVKLQEEREPIFASLVDASADQQPTIISQLETIDAEIAELTAQIDAINLEIEPMLVELNTRLDSLSQPILRGYFPSLEAIRADVAAAAHPEIGNLLLVNYLTEDSNRLSQISFGGDLASYVTTTLIHGRPGSNDVWPQAMVSWSQEGGGPLRRDEIDDIVAYVLNWDKGGNWSVDDLNNVGQFARLHAPYTGIIIDGEPPIGNDVTAILAALPEVTGDAARGEQLYNGQAASEFRQPVGCSSCHLGGQIGPNIVGTYTRVEAERLTLPQFADYTVEQYIVESIVKPGAFAVPGFAGQMPLTFGAQLSIQDLADLLAYIQAQG